MVSASAMSPRLPHAASPWDQTNAASASAAGPAPATPVHRHKAFNIGRRRLAHHSAESPRQEGRSESGPGTAQTRGAPDTPEKSAGRVETTGRQAGDKRETTRRSAGRNRETDNTPAERKLAARQARPVSVCGNPWASSWARSDAALPGSRPGIRRHPQSCGRPRQSARRRPCRGGATPP